MSYSQFWVPCRQLIGWCVVVFSCAFLSSLAMSSEALSWYHTLQMPMWSPPDWIFGPVWSGLYFLMALSIWFVYRTSADLKQKRRAYFFFGVQLLLNALWTPLFFGLHYPLLALIDLVVLIIFIVVTAFSFYKIKPIAGWLFIPYLIWSLFAGVLNGVLWWNN